MRVLHVHQIAHIPQLFCRELRGRGIEAKFVERASSDIVNEFDIIHGHYALNRHTIEAFRMARKNGVPFVLHCHGSDLRLLTGTERVGLPFHYRTISQYVRKRSQAILLSTPDLIEFEPHGTYLPNPVDLDFFKPMPELEKSHRHLIMGKLIRGSRILEFIKLELEYDCVNNGQEIRWPPNVRELPLVPYEDLPAFFNHYTHMLGTFGDLISMARLEAMACGLSTFTDFEGRFTTFYDGESPDLAEDPRDFIRRFHSPRISVDRLIETYEKLSP